MLINGIAKTMSEVREEQKNTIQIRCEKAVELASGKTSVYWCNFNDESRMLSELDNEAVEIIGSQSIEQKEDILIAFANGEINRLITKPKITSFGLNWQHCNHTVYFPTWSYEQYYQAIRRFWRFGQKNEVHVDLVLSDGQKRVVDALLYKTEKAIEFNELIKNTLKNTVDFNHANFNKEIQIPKFI